MKTRPITHYVAASRKGAAAARRMKQVRAEILRAKALADAREQSHTGTRKTLVLEEESDCEGQAVSAQGEQASQRREKG